MKTYLDCIPCFYRQALDAGRLAFADEKTQKKILDNVAEILPGFPLESKPPEMGIIIHRIIKKLTNNKDPYYEVKKRSNDLALSLYTQFKKKISKSSDRLKTAVEIAIAGNIIDYGVKNSINIKQELIKILEEEDKAVLHERKELFNFKSFKDSVRKADTILYLGDNAGEIVFDRILIEEIKAIDNKKKIYFAVRHKPIINDVCIEDALTCGIDKTAEIISSGCETPSTIISLCSKKFLKIYKQADMIISKGQGNFEGLSDENRKIFFLFMAKCPVIAKHINSNVGDFILFIKQG